MGLVIIVKNADFSSNNVGNIFGFPSLPSGLNGLYLPRISLEESSRDRSLLSDDSPPFTEIRLTETDGWEYKSTYLEKKARSSGLSTPFDVPSNGWVTAFVFYSNPYINNLVIETLLGLEGFEFSEGGIRLRSEAHADGSTRTRFSASWWDGNDIVGSSSSLFDSTNMAVTPEKWNMVFYRHDPSSRTVSLVCPGTETLYNHTFPDGTDLYVTPENGGINLFCDTASSANPSGSKYAMFGLWDRALSDREIINEAYPKLKDYMMEQGVSVL